jgi:1-acyl-sn-glycerol-3-phosphate acyltransferase
MLLLVPLVIIASFMGKVRGGNIIYDICRFWADAWLFLVGIRHRNLYETPHDPSRQYIFVSNHISYLDVPVMMKAIRKQHFRVLGKAELGSIPVFGFIFKKAAVSVDRKNADNRAKSVLVLKSIIKRKISVFIFPEGTFNMTRQPLKDFYDGAFRIAVETQTPLKPIIILDSYKRFNYHSIFSLKPGRSRAVFLEETSTEGLTVSDVPMLKQKIYKQMEEALVRYNAGWVCSGVN